MGMWPGTVRAAGPYRRWARGAPAGLARALAGALARALAGAIAVVLATAAASAVMVVGLRASPAHATGNAVPAAQGTYVDPLAHRHGRLPKGAELLYIDGPARVHPVRPGFLGLSIEYSALEPYAGADPGAVNPLFVQLVRNLTAGQTPVLRIGGDSTDWTWWPVKGMAQPQGIKYTLTRRWLAVAGALERALRARLILGLNLEADSSRITQTEAIALASGLPRGAIEAFEPGNEPELYGSWTYYRAHDGRAVTGRPAGYSFGAFERDFAGVRQALPGVPLAGPTTGSRKWLGYLPGFLRAEPRLGLVTLHRYPLQLCYIPTFSPRYPTLAHLLSARASRGLAAIVGRYVGLVHRRGLQLRLDELNTDGCGSAPRVTHTFASALWALDTLFALAQAGVDGVNMHTYPGADYQLFSFFHGRSRIAHGWSAQIAPEYYGLLTFAAAAPPGSQPLRLSGPATTALSAWAVRAPDGQPRVALINKGPEARTIAVRAPAATTYASLIRLSAPSATSATGITLAGERFASPTRTGLLTGRPRQWWIAPARHTYLVGVPAYSAAVLTLP